MHSRRSAVRQPTRWLRIGIPVLLILVWLVGGSIGGPYFGKVDEVSTNDRRLSCPRAPTRPQVSERLPDFLGGDTIPAVVVVTGEGELTETSSRTSRPSPTTSPSIDGVGRRLAADPVRGRRGGADLRAHRPSGEVGEIVEEIRTISPTTPDGLQGMGDRSRGLHRRSRRGLPRHRRTAAGGRAHRGVRHPRDRLSIAPAAGPRAADVACSRCAWRC